VVGQARIWLDLGRLLKNSAVPAGRQSAATACYRTALRLTSGDVGNLQNISTTAPTATTTF